MESFVATLAIAGAIALLLWGAHMVQSGVQRAFGARLRAVLAGTLRNRLAALLAGIGVTTLLQSSTATALMATNFTAAGLVELVPAMAVMLGANIGTALIVTVLSFNVVVLSAPLIAGGVLLFRLDRSAMSHDLGRVLIGLGLMLLALHQLLEALEPMASSAEVVALLGLLGAMPLLAVLLGALASWAVHSSVAVVLLIISLASHGVVGFESALLLVLGANLGTALNPLFEAGDGDPAARRLPLANLFNRLVGVAIAWVALAPIMTLLRGTGLGEGTSLALFHLGFNIVMALLALPSLRQIAALMTRLVPDREDTADPARPIYLDHAALETPMMALGGAQREALRLADALEAMLTGARDALVRHDRRLVAETRAMDDTLDGLNTAIKRYLALFDEDDLSDEDRQKLHQIMVFSMNMEQAGDVLDRNLLPHATKRFKRGLLPDADSEVELVAMMDRLIANTRMAASLFVTEDANVARILAAEKVVFRRTEQNVTTRHFSHMRDGFSAASQSSALHLDLMRDMKLVNSFIVAAAAYPLLDKAGELLESRLASSAE